MMMMKMKLFPSCTQQPKTMSFRQSGNTITKEEEIYKIINSVYFDPDDDSVETPDPWFTNSSESASTIVTEFDEEEIIRGARAQQMTDQRLFFEPLGETSSILSSDEYSLKNHIYKEIKTDVIPKYRRRRRKKVSAYLKARSVTMAVESEDPYMDFRRSMEEMMEISMEGRTSHDYWEALEELLGFYLKANDKTNHGYIVAAFVDLLFGIVNHQEICDQQANKSTTSFSSAVSSLSSSASTSTQE